MLARVRLFKPAVCVVLSIMLAASSLAVAGQLVHAVPAHADTAPLDPATPATVSADALPTVQINGVVWSQVTVGNTVYATGSFTSARPAGSAAGTNETPRLNLLAYDITTGDLITTFNHSLNAQGLVVAASPDQSTIYVGGDFTAVDGKAHQHIAAFSVSTGALVNTFAPTVNDRVHAIAPTDTSVYFGGKFTTVNGVSRTQLAAVTAGNAGLLPWAPAARGGVVATMVLTPSGTNVIAGGQFTSVNGSSSAYGLAALDATSGALRPWATAAKVLDGGDDAGIFNLNSDGTQIYGTGWVYGPGGNFEGTFAASPDTGALQWMEDCHGDTYGTFVIGQAVYAVSHEHSCDTIGAFPETSPRTFHRATAFTTGRTGTIAHNIDKRYDDWIGNPAPTQLDWYPNLFVGTYTGQHQAAWSVSGNSSYLTLGGEFPRVNGSAQQGLVRFAVSALAPNKLPPQASDGLTPTASSVSAGAVRLAFQSTWDPDNGALIYKIVRDGDLAAPVYTTTVESRLWNLPTISYTDSGLAPGSTHTYRVYVFDPFGNSTTGHTVSVTVPSQPADAYVQDVLQDNAVDFWRLDETSGTTFADSVRTNPLTSVGGVSPASQGAISAGDAAAQFDGSTGTAGSTTASRAPDTFSIESWFKTTTTRGGKLVGYGNSHTGSSSLYDRHVYLDNSGHLIFGVYSNAVKTLTSPGRYNDGTWHQVVATLSGDGMFLYVDGLKVASDAGTTTGLSYSGYWRVGGDNLTGWISQPASRYVNGTLDDVSVYATALTSSQVGQQFTDSGRTLGTSGARTNHAPVAAFTKTCVGLNCTFSAAGSSDRDGSVNAYSWRFGDGTTTSSITPKTTHAFAIAGDYPMSLTVTDNEGARAVAKHVVTVRPPANKAPAPFATDTFRRTVSGGFGTAPIGGGWSTTAAADLSVSPGQGSLLLAKSAVRHTTYLLTQKSSDTRLRAWFTTNKLVSGGGAYAVAVGRRVSANHEYRARINFLGKRIGVQLTKLTGSASDVAITKEVLLPNVTYKPGLKLNVQFDIIGTKPTRLSLKVWPATGAVPKVWTLTARDATSALQAKGSVGVGAVLPSTSAGAPVKVQVGAFTAARPLLPPTAAFTVSHTGSTYSVKGAASKDPSGTITRYAWSWGDGKASSGASARHTYTTRGKYRITLTVTDPSKWISVTTRTVTV